MRVLGWALLIIGAWAIIQIPFKNWEQPAAQLFTDHWIQYLAGTLGVIVGAVILALRSKK